MFIVLNSYLLLCFSIQRHISGLSRALHDGFGIKFGDVTVLLPPKWRADNFSIGSADRSVAPNNLTLVDVLIRESKTDISRPDIYTQHLLGCGHEALYLYMNHKYVASWTDGMLYRYS